MRQGITSEYTLEQRMQYWNSTAIWQKHGPRSFQFLNSSSSDHSLIVRPSHDLFVVEFSWFCNLYGHPILTVIVNARDIESDWSPVI
jgi:hypothetical protein